MTAENPPPRTALQRAVDGRSYRHSWRDARAWRDAFGDRALPAYVLVALFIMVFVAQWFTGGPLDWGLSAQALAEGRWHTLGAHMTAHGGIAHLWMNSAALLALTSPVMARLGAGTTGWPRYMLVFVAAGLSGAAFYLLLDPAGAIPMVGASGAICGLWGAAARIGPDGHVTPLRSRQVWRNIRDFTVMNLVLFALLFVLAAGRGGGLAWEAHLGGFLFGLLAMPRLAPAHPPADWKPPLVAPAEQR